MQPVEIRMSWKCHSIYTHPGMFWECCFMGPWIQIWEDWCLLLDDGKMLGLIWEIGIDILRSMYLFIFFFGHLAAYGVPWPGIRAEPQLWCGRQLQQCWILNPVLGQGANLCPSASERPPVLSLSSRTYRPRQELLSAPFKFALSEL